MPYATVAQFQLKLSDQEAFAVSDLDDDGRGSVQSGRIEDALVAASADIDSALILQGYSIPLPTTTTYPILSDICVYLAWEKLNTFGDRAEVEKHANNARERLNKIRVTDANGNPVDRAGDVTVGGGGDGKTYYNAGTFVGNRSTTAIAFGGS